VHHAALLLLAAAAAVLHDASACKAYACLLDPSLTPFVSRWAGTCRVGEGPPIHVQLVGPASVSHDFDNAPFCTVRLLLRVRNTLPSPVSVCIETGKGPDGRPTPLGEPQAGLAGMGPGLQVGLSRKDLARQLGRQCNWDARPSSITALY
jgi:hypothetical protein